MPAMVERMSKEADQHSNLFLHLSLIVARPAMAVPRPVTEPAMLPRHGTLSSKGYDLPNLVIVLGLQAVLISKLVAVSPEAADASFKLVNWHWSVSWQRSIALHKKVPD